MKTKEVIKIAKKILKKTGKSYIFIDSEGYKITIEKLKK